MPGCLIERIAFQTRSRGHHTDDCAVFLTDSNGVERKILIQVKTSIKIASKEFKKVIKDAWLDFSGKKFSKQLDIIALITSNLSESDNKVIEIFDYVHKCSAGSYKKFWEDYRTSLMFSKSSCDKFEKFIDYIVGVDNKRPSDKDIFGFCKIFHIFKTDLSENFSDIGGINLALLHSILDKMDLVKDPQDVWNGIVTYVESLSKDKQEIFADELSQNLTNLFEKKKVFTEQNCESSQNSERNTVEQKTTRLPFQIKTQHEKELALFGLIGSFDKDNKNDQKLISQLYGKSFQDFQIKLQEISTQDSSVKIIDGIWKVDNRLEIVTTLSHYIFDDDVDGLKKVFLQVVGEIDPALSLPVDKRYMSNVFGKSRKFSRQLRDGIANGMAMLANNADKFPGCSLNKIKNTATSAVRELLKDFINPDVWASTKSVTTEIAETEPDEFLNKLEQALTVKTKNNPFVRLANDHNHNNIFSEDYLSGIRWALADLSWDKELFVRASLALGKLAGFENVVPNGQNHSIDILVGSVLPWRSQTLASTNTRYKVVENILKDNIKVGWQVLENLLPGKTMTIAERQRPIWRSGIVPEDWGTKGVNSDDRRGQEDYYSELLVRYAETTEQICEVIENITHITPNAIEKLINKLNLLSSRSLPVADKNSIWETLLKKINHNKRFADAKWALPKVTMKKLSTLADKLAPKDVVLKYARLFNDYNHKLIDRKDWKEGESRLKKERKQAIEEVLATGGLGSVLKLVDVVKFPRQVGIVLSEIDGYDIDRGILPKYIDDKDTHGEFMASFIAGRYHTMGGVKWVDSMNMNNWPNKQKIGFVLSLPFETSTWSIVEKQPRVVGEAYWKQTDNFISAYHQPYSSYAINRLLEVGRPLAAVECISYSLHFSKDNEQAANAVDISQCERALLESTRTTELDEKTNISHIKYEITQVIEYLQSHVNFDTSSLWEIEWCYLALFKEYSSTLPKALIYKISNEPDMFCEMIQMAFKSKKGSEKKPELSEATTYNLMKILHTNDFPIMPGTDKNGKFNVGKFKNWINVVERTCKKTGHLDSARRMIGQLLINSPKDRSGLWIHKTVAETLNRKDAKGMRESFNIAVINSRGIHAVDPSGTDEMALSEKWGERAKQVEEAGYFEFAMSLRNLSKNFELEHNRVIVEHRKYEEGVGR